MKLHEVRLEPYGVGQVVKTVWGEWTAFKVWDQSSINVYRGVAKGALLYPVPAAALWVAFSIALVWLGQLATRRYRQSPLLLTATIATVTVWILLDGLWLQQLLRQNVETRYLFAGKTLHEKKLADWDGEYYAFASAIKELLPAERTEIGILYTPADSSPMAHRARIHLLPEHHATSIHPLNNRYWKSAKKRFSYLIILTGPGADLTRTDAPLDSLGFNKSNDMHLLHIEEPAALYRIVKRGSEVQP
ncbi:hypothetical protein [Kineobactrum salinum]|uniref:Uncharacterized protein n=1 Tax=Kineobactrum salinum TaxID=2708301 RepID=A0A6C0U3H1_9GAMM|nr:hypothetical protein [Kineobactrum salinum]QIB65979.1 hypothetical protein G3T16_11665 [Kineobactrum salinum]